MKTATRLCLLVCAVSFLSPSASAQLNQDWSSPDGSGGDGCWLCDDEKRCVAAPSGATGKENCQSGQSCTDECLSDCTRSGNSCTGKSALRLERMWVVPNGEPSVPVLRTPPKVVEDARPCT
jgi:hypothetical protein